jgi:hypothetical protein
MIKRRKKNVRSHSAVFEKGRKAYYAEKLLYSKSSGGLIYYGGRFTL